MFPNLSRYLVILGGWPILIAGSVYILIKGRHVYKLVRGSLVGRIVQVLIFMMLIAMFSLGVFSTICLYAAPRSDVVVFPAFIVWLLIYVWALRILEQAQNETERIIGKRE